MNLSYGISRRAFLAGTATAGAAVVLHPFAVQAAAGQAHLRIMETTDVHVAVFPYDYYADAPNDTLGLARTASIIDAIRAEAGNSILVDNGDVIQGNPMGDYIAYEKGLSDGAPHPVIAAMNTLGYEVGTLGNHEFNYGLSFLSQVTGSRFNVNLLPAEKPIPAQSCAGPNFPLVLSNVLSVKDRQPLFKPYVILDRTLKAVGSDGKCVLRDPPAG